MLYFDTAITLVQLRYMLVNNAETEKQMHVTVMIFTEDKKERSLQTIEFVMVLFIINVFPCIISSFFNKDIYGKSHLLLVQI